MAQRPSMGMGTLGGQSLVFKRKFRWALRLTWRGNDLSEDFVKLAARPSLSIEETEINFLNSKMWIPGKASWETITVTYYDVGGLAGQKSMKNLYSWLATVYDFTNNLGNRKQASSIETYGGSALLSLYDGCGEVMETWKLTGVWPTSVNFGDLDYSSSEEVTIELTLRFNDATYSNHCPGFDIEALCGGCSGPTRNVGSVEPNGIENVD